MPARDASRTRRGWSEALSFHRSMAGLHRLSHAVAQGGKEGGIGSDPMGIMGLDSCVVVRRKERDSPISQERSLAQQPVNLMQAEDVSNIKPTRGIEAGQNTLLKPGGRDKENEKEMNILDWAKDSGDKFYSLTEESDFSSGGEHSLRESGSSISTERGNLSSSNKPTVWQRRRQRKCTKTRPGSQEGTEFSDSSGSKILKWDYSGIRLMDTTGTTDIFAVGGQQLVDNNMEGSNGDMISDACMVSTDSGMLQSIYNSINELQTETLIESRRARVATKQLQVAKSCTEIEAKLGSMDERIAVVEEDVDILKQQNAMQEDQLTGIMWKLEDFENQQRRNNLRFLGINEGLEHVVEKCRLGKHETAIAINDMCKVFNYKTEDLEKCEASILANNKGKPFKHMSEEPVTPNE
ncbi:hypothetical protein NDU88_002483 [Pleurodeles waltl]|uniref:Uncharacterized protein n=1 Tax=Pleurodeles waltl TaxID=8319 RepID=A0AAV7TKT0_PLEWA|nr:hypothetical protein NDU88_002483 [Pleurodeles waltl]